MREHSFPVKHMPEETVEWITAPDAQRPRLIVKGLLAREPEFFREHSISQDEALALAEMAWEVCEPLKIMGLYDVICYFWGSVLYGVYFHKDMRWGVRNCTVMEDLSMNAEARMDRLLTQCHDVYERCVANSKTDNMFLLRAARRFVRLDIASYLPQSADNPVKLAEAVCRQLWPEFIDVMPDQYFQLTGMYLSSPLMAAYRQSDWEIALTIAAAAVLGRYFMEDPGYAPFCAKLKDNAGLQGRDKAVDMLVSLQNWLRAGWLAGEN